MGKRKIVIRESVAESIAEAAWFIESKGLIVTAEKFSDSVYDFIDTLSDDMVAYPFFDSPFTPVRSVVQMPLVKGAG